jgi:chromosome segregation ATPase
LNALKAEIRRTEKDLSLKVTKKDLAKVKQEIEEAQASVSAQLEIAKNTIASGSSRIDSYSRIVQTIKEDLKHQNDAVRKIPPNVDKLIKDVQKELVTCQE